VTAQVKQAFDVTSLLLAAGVIAGPLFLLVALIDGARRPGYDLMSMPISLLAVGEQGWLQTTNFLVTGALFGLFAAGTYRAMRDSGTRSLIGPTLIALMAFGVIMAGMFTTDPGGGFPPGVTVPREATTHGMLHDLASLLVFPTLIVCCLYFALWFYRRAQRGWAAYSAGTCVVLAVTFGALLSGFNGNETTAPIAGLMQRVFLVAGWGWLAVLGLELMRSRMATQRSAR